MTDTADAPETSTEPSTETPQAETTASAEAATTDTTTPETLSDNAQAVADAVTEKTGETPKDSEFDFVLDKYKADGRSEQEAAMEQAKAYKELQGKFGSFTGAPEEYEVKLSEEMSERINLEDFKDDPLMADFKEVAKEMGLNNDGFNAFSELYFKSQLATEEAMETVRDEEKKSLGPQAERRIANIQDWAGFNLDAETKEQLESALTSASAVQAFEAIIAKTRNAPQLTDTAPAASMSSADAAKMLNAVDENGNPMMHQKEYANKVRKIYDQLHGAEPRKVIVG